MDCFTGDFYNNDAAIVVGSEASGVDARVLGICDGVISIPMYGHAESLNAGIAAGILMYEFLRRG